MALPLVFAPVLPELVVGIALLLLAFAAIVLLQKPLQALAARVPVVGGHIADGIGSAIDWVVNTALSWVKAQVDAVVSLVAVPFRVANDVSSWAASFAEAVAYQVTQIADRTIGEVGRLADRLGDLAAKLNTAARQAGRALSQVADLRNWAHAFERVVVPALVATAVAAVRSWAGDLVQAERGARSEAVQAARAQAQALHAQATEARKMGDDDLARQLAKTAALLEAAVIAAQAAGRTYSDEQRRALEAQLEHITNVAIPAAMAGALAVARATAGELTQVRRTCIDPLCGAFGSSIDLWNALATGAELALVVGLVSNAMSDPEGAAEGAVGLVDGGVGMARGIAGAFGVSV